MKIKIVLKKIWGFYSSVKLRLIVAYFESYVSFMKENRLDLKFLNLVLHSFLIWS